MAEHTDVFNALADPTRRQLVEILVSGSAQTATELAGTLPITRQGVSKHLTILEGAGLLTARKEGRERRYQFNPAPLTEAEDWLAAIRTEWQGRLNRLGRYLQDEFKEN